MHSNVTTTPCAFGQVFGSHHAPSLGRIGRSRSSSIYHLDDCGCSSIRCAWKQLQRATGPCQLWATCDPVDSVFSLNFVSTCFDAWLRNAQKYDEKVLFGVLGCLVNGSMRFFKVVRVGKNVDPQTEREMKEEKAQVLDMVIDNVEGELQLSPDADRAEVVQAIAQHLDCDPKLVRV